MPYRKRTAEYHSPPHPSHSSTTFLTELSMPLSSPWVAIDFAYGRPWYNVNLPRSR
jgi:hypothetical protein